VGIHGDDLKILADSGSGSLLPDCLSVKLGSADFKIAFHGNSPPLFEHPALHPASHIDPIDSVADDHDHSEWLCYSVLQKDSQGKQYWVPELSLTTSLVSDKLRLPQPNVPVPLDILLFFLKCNHGRSAI
jgi:hypothetical protein